MEKYFHLMWTPGNGVVSFILAPASRGGGGRGRREKEGSIRHKLGERKLINQNTKLCPYLARSHDFTLKAVYAGQ